MSNVKNNEYDRADFQGVYQGKSLIESAEIKTVPWEIGRAQPVVCDLLKKGARGKLLDVGCGLGRNAEAAAEMGYDVTAIDNAPTAIESCQDRQMTNHIRFKVANACATGLNETFDTILDSATYHAIPSNDRAAYMGEMRRLANEVTEYHLITFAPSVRGMPKPLAIELSEIVDTAEKSGWQIESVSRVEYKGNAEAIADFCKKKNLTILLDEEGLTRLPSWHVILKTVL
ncbi:class I SAM-dependent methyltransferase [Xenorhabdus sp. M]|uniref:Class I SAM-dependent methyltransferase n=1 Tax=Xenorhabdus szentirmaii TaxID=290112 RepID=A0AAW3Z0S9_9GAMM|nr:class I SAM-dependent methyltransferase [Xenorhabdus sp. M]MBD2802611.1 class I SAM-dependent methyltransferase [Xenorhabdus sp. M]